MWRFKGHSMVVLNCGIPTIMLELTLISFCNIVNQITLHLKESRTRDLQLIFYILNLYTMQQLAFSPGSRDGGYICACMCVTFALKNLHLFSHLSKKIGKVPLFIILHDLASHSSFLLQFSKGQWVLLDSSPSSTSPLKTLSALLCWVWPQQRLWAQADTSKHYGKPCPGSISHFLWCVCCESCPCEGGRWWRAPWSCSRAPSKAAPCRTQGSAKVGTGSPSGPGVGVPCLLLKELGRDGPSLQHTVLLWSHCAARGGRAQLHLCAALSAARPALLQCKARLPAGIHTEPRDFPICKIFLVLIII